MKIFLQIVVLFTTVIPMNAQGLIFDEDAFTEGEHIEMERSYNSPDRASLKKYCPPVYLQRNSTCVAVSVAYANTMTSAIAKNTSNNYEIISSLGSPHWVYHRNKGPLDDDCEDGLSIEKVVTDVLNYGIAPMSMVEYPDYYPFENATLCNYYPDVYEYDILIANANKPDNIYRVKEIDEYKLALSLNMPIVFGMMVPPSFSLLNKSEIWTPSKLESRQDGYGHAMIIVGYNDKIYGGAFEVMNSWGSDWGKNGFAWIRSEDFEKFAVGGDAFHKERNCGASNEALEKAF